MAASAPDDIRAILARTHLPALDGLRACAVGLVIAYHAGVPVYGDLGVTGFFVLSGFLITWLLIREFRDTGTISMRDFYIRRTLRIFPAYYAFLVFTVVADAILWVPRSTLLTVAAFTYTTNYYFAFHPHAGSLALTWSLAVEEQFYLLWPALARRCLVAGLPAMRAVLVAIIAFVVAWRSYLFLVRHVGTLYVYSAFDARADSLAIGCLMASTCQTDAFAALARRLTASPLLPVIPALVLSLPRTGAFWTAWHYAIGFTLEASMMAVIIIQMLMLSRHRLWRWLESPVARYLGRISYPLYLWHGYGLAIGDHVPAGTLAQRVLGVIAAIGLATGSYFIVERPMLRLRSRFIPGPA